MAAVTTRAAAPATPGRWEPVPAAFKDTAMRERGPRAQQLRQQSLHHCCAAHGVGRHHTGITTSRTRPPCIHVPTTGARRALLRLVFPRLHLRLRLCSHRARTPEPPAAQSRLNGPKHTWR